MASISLNDRRDHAQFAATRALELKREYERDADEYSKMRWHEVAAACNHAAERAGRIAEEFQRMAESLEEEAAGPPPQARAIRSAH